MRKLLALIILLLAASPALCSITYFGRASNPADNAAPGKFNNDSPLPVTPPASMVTGDLAIIDASWSGCTATQTLTIGTTGGQNWTSETNHAYDTPGLCVRTFWARYNGTWAANPTVVASTPSTYTGMTVTMTVFRPTTGTNTWATDVAESAALFSAPGGSFDVTVTGQTSIAANTVTRALWVNYGSMPTWALQNGGWTNPGGVTQVRNPANTYDVISHAYKIQTSAAATGDATNRESSNAQGYKAIQTWKEVSASADWTTIPFASARSSTTHTLSFQAGGSGNVWAVGCHKGSTAPTIAQVKAGQCTGSVAALAANNKAVTTAADTLVLTYALPLLVYDVYSVGNFGADTALVSLPTEIAGAASGYTTPQPLVSVCTIETCPVAKYNAVESTDLVTGDYFSCQASSTPNAFTNSFGTDGNFVFSQATTAKQTFNCKYHDISAQGMATGANPAIFVVNNSVPTCGSPQTIHLERDVAVTTGNLISPCTDGDGDALTAVITGGTLNTGLSMDGSGAPSGTPTVNGSSTITITVTDTAGDTATQTYTIIVESDSEVPNCVGLTAPVCEGLLSVAGLTVAPIYQYSSSVAAGIVLSTDPSQGTVDLGSTVTMYVSLGTIAASPAVSGYTFAVDPDQYAVIYGAAWLWHSKPSPTCQEVIAHVGALSYGTVTSTAGEQVTLTISNVAYPRSDVSVVSVSATGQCSAVSTYPGLRKSPGTNRIYLPVDVP